jgi:hypothetical protein
MRQIKAAIAGILTLFAATSAAAQTFPTIPPNTVVGRMGIGSGPAQAIPQSTLFSSGLFDTTLGSTRGSIPYRGISGWTGLAPGAAGSLLQSGGAGADPSWLALPLSIAKGGTGQTTAAAARASSGLNVEGYTGHGDSNYTILSTDRTVGTTATLTAARVWTLPAANSVNAGQEITVADYFGGVSSTNTLTIQRSGSDTVSGSTSTVLNSAYARVSLRSDGVSKWSVSSSSSSLTKTPMDYGAACDGSTDDRTAIQAWLNGISGTAIGVLPPGLTCTYSLYVIVPSNVTIYNYGTFKARNGANAATGFLLTDATGGTVAGPTNVKIYGGTWDGNKANRTGPFSYANIYLAGVTDVTIRDVISKDCTSDCFYVGGNVTTTGLSTNVHMSNVKGINSGRNGLSLVGVQNFQLVGCQMTGSVTASPWAGIDVEPDSTNTPNNDFTISDCELSGNLGAGIAINPAALAGAIVNRGRGVSLSANSNGGCGFDQYVTTANAAGFRFIGVSGTGNTGGLLCNLAADKVP